MNKRDIAAKLNEAADLIDRLGWWGGTGEYDGRVICAAVAIDRTTETEGDYSAVAGALRRFVGIGNEMGALATWNDNQTDGGVVIAALRGAAASISPCSEQRDPPQ